jgi:hypothetical protein
MVKPAHLDNGYNWRTAIHHRLVVPGRVDGHAATWHPIHTKEEDEDCPDNNQRETSADYIQYK